MSAITYYTALLNSADCPVEADGKVMFENGQGQMVPVKCVGKDLVLPTPAFLAKPDWDTFVAFHPVSESIARGESEVLQKLQDIIRLKLWKQYTALSEELLIMASTDKLKGNVNAAQAKVLGPLAEADEKTIKSFNQIISKSTPTYNGGEDHRLINLYLRRGGTANGERYSRQCVVSFPLYEAVCRAEDSKERKVFGVELRVKDIKVLKALHETMLPGSDTDAYNFGTTAGIAPYFVALMGSYVNIANQLNTILKPFSRIVKTITVIDTSWDRGEDLKAFRNEIPAMPHNEGISANKDEPTVAPVSAPQPVVPQQAPAMQAPVVQQPQVAQTGTAMPAPGYPQPYQQPYGYGFQQPQPQPTQPQQPIMDTKPSTSGTVKWGDVVGSGAPVMTTPALGMQPQMPGMMPMPGFQQFPGMQPMGMPQPMFQQPNMGMQPQQPWQPQMPMPLMANGQPQPQMPQVSTPMQPMQGFQQFPNQFPGMMPMPGFQQPFPGYIR